MYKILIKIAAVESGLLSWLDQSGLDPEKRAEIAKNWAEIKDQTQRKVSPIMLLRDLELKVQEAQDLYGHAENLQPYAIVLSELSEIIRLQLIQQKQQVSYRLATSLAVRYKHYKIYQNILPAQELHPYKTFAVGNDPVLTGVATQELARDYALVATGGLRSLWIISQLRKPHCRIPQLYIVDNSSHVMNFWEIFQMMFELSEGKKQLFEKLKFPRLHFGAAMHANQHMLGLPEEHNGFHTDNMLTFLQSFIKTEEDFQFFKRVVKKVELIAQNWESKPTMEAINRACHLAGREIVAYPSNIFEYMKKCASSAAANGVLEAIETLAPKFSIHTVTSLARLQQIGHISPDRIVFVTNNQAVQVVQQLEEVINTKSEIAQQVTPPAGDQKEVVGAQPVPSEGPPALPRSGPPSQPRAPVFSRAEDWAELYESLLYPDRFEEEEEEEEDQTAAAQYRPAFSPKP